jgi:hypothetical protein
VHGRFKKYAIVGDAATRWLTFCANEDEAVDAGLLWMWHLPGILQWLVPIKKLLSCSRFIDGIIIAYYVASNMWGISLLFSFQCIASDPFSTGNFVIFIRRFAVVFVNYWALGHLADTTLNALTNHQRPFLLDGSGRVVGRNDGAFAVARQIVKAKGLVDASLTCVWTNDDKVHIITVTTFALTFMALSLSASWRAAAAALAVAVARRRCWEDK